MSTLTATAFSPEITVGAIVAAHPALARFFEHLGIDYCCGGKQPIGEACAEHNLDVATTLKLLQTAAQALDSIPTEVNAAAMTLTQLADHIETTHHAWLKTELPRLLEMAERVARKHGPRDPRLREMDATLHKLANEFYEHMKQEETALFPLVRRIEARTAVAAQVKTLALAVKQMEVEHESAGQLTLRLRELTDNFTPDAEACNTQRALFAGLATFEADLHRHVHKENNILFPRALALAA